MDRESTTYRGVTFYIYTVDGRYTADTDHHMKTNLVSDEQKAILDFIVWEGVVSAFFKSNGSLVVTIDTKHLDRDKVERQVMQAIELAKHY